LLLVVAAAQEDLICSHVPRFSAASAVCAAIAKFVAEQGIVQPFSVAIGDSQQRLFSYTFKGFNDNEPIVIFSASKFLTAATVMRLVDEGTISLEDKTSKYIDWWTTDSKDPRSHTTLRHHLSMTDGFGQHVDATKYPAPFPVCWAQAEHTAETCTREAYDLTYGHYGRWFISPPSCRDSRSFLLTDPDVPYPGQAFYYEENHWDMTELMVEKATGQKFNDVANSRLFKPFGMEASYGWPSPANPDTGGGVVTTGPHYEKFLRALLGGKLLSAGALENLLKPHTTKAKEGYSIMECYGVDSTTTFGYALGNWLHCKERMPSACLNNHRHSSLGFGGFLPVVDRALGLYLVIAQFDPSGASQTSALRLQELIFSILDSQPKTEL